MVSHKKKDSDNGALGGSGGRGSYQSIADDANDDAVGDNKKGATPDPTPQKTKKPGVFRRLSRSLRKAFNDDEKTDPELRIVKARESRWKAQAEQELNGLTDPDNINFLGAPNGERSLLPYTDYTSNASLHNKKPAERKPAEPELRRISNSNQPQANPTRTQSLSQPTSRTYSSRARPTRRSNTMTTSLGRSASLSQRFPGDMSHRPLDQIKRETKVANRGPHLRKTTLPRADPIDSLDNILGHSYHHEGPFDATLASRNVNKKYAPIEAVKSTNEEALKATPKELVQDSLTKHVPLQGTANIPPGATDVSGRRMSYEEGTDLQRDPMASGGPSRRYEDIDYHPDDVKGKGEAFTIERAFKHGKSPSTDETGVYEMQPAGSSKSSPSKNGDVMVRQRSRSSSLGEGTSSSAAGATSSSSPGKRITTGLKKRIGSIRRKAGRDS